MYTLEKAFATRPIRWHRLAYFLGNPVIGILYFSNLRCSSAWSSSWLSSSVSSSFYGEVKFDRHANGLSTLPQLVIFRCPFHTLAEGLYLMYSGLKLKIKAIAQAKPVYVAVISWEFESYLHTVSMSPSLFCTNLLIYILPSPSYSQI